MKSLKAPICFWLCPSSKLRVPRQECMGTAGSCKVARPSSGMHENRWELQERTSPFKSASELPR
eukprot:1156390-Pelagomonas_calceolata.AAC.6